MTAWRHLHAAVLFIHIIQGNPGCQQIGRIGALPIVVVLMPAYIPGFPTVRRLEEQLVMPESDRGGARQTRRHRAQERMASQPGQGGVGPVGVIYLNDPIHRLSQRGMPRPGSTSCLIDAVHNTGIVVAECFQLFAGQNAGSQPIPILPIKTHIRIGRQQRRMWLLYARFHILLSPLSLCLLRAVNDLCVMNRPKSRQRGELAPAPGGAPGNELGGIGMASFWPVPAPVWPVPAPVWPEPAAGGGPE